MGRGYVVSSDAILLVEHSLAGSILNLYRFDSGLVFTLPLSTQFFFGNFWVSYYLFGDCFFAMVAFQTLATSDKKKKQKP
jgi:hypothetical protein